MSVREYLSEVFGPDSPQWLSQFTAGLLTITSVVIVALLWRQPGALPDPGLILLLTVATSTYLAGGMAGMACAAIVLFCSFFLFSHSFQYSEMDGRQVIVIMITSPLIALMVGSLKDQVDQLEKARAELQRLKGELRRVEGYKDATYLCEQRFRTLTQGISEYATFMLDTDGTVVHWNPGAERLLGYTDKEMTGQSYARFFTKEDVLGRRPEKLLENTRFSGRVVEEGGFVRRNGARFYSRLSVTVLRNQPGNVIGYLALVRDLTEIADKMGKA
jgi:PAS domain S-box-containing protein